MDSRNQNLGRKITFKQVPLKHNGDVSASSLDQLDDLITVDVYEGYKKLGRYRLSSARLKFK